ncbi:hypothetical protein MSAR_24850 [Mycolicibacterium sarraceniae]|uniref:Glycoside hydrolase family 5 domain-containing protein n=2 Tax=Mycolicibacterium sarraceniae TaxID=1534348 RepID=A0A7I7ST70_9MYCO|nr:hypothetical protein MSAR_24850 [Mycolicibacterium sarraceniae]
MLDRRSLLRAAAAAAVAAASNRGVAHAENPESQSGLAVTRKYGQGIKPTIQGWDMWFDAALIGGRIVMSDDFIDQNRPGAPTSRLGDAWSGWDPSLRLDAGMVSGSGLAWAATGVADGAVVATFTAGEDVRIELLPRFVDPANYVSVVVQSGSVVLRARVSGIDTTLGSAPGPPFSPGAPYWYRVEFRGGVYAVTTGLRDTPYIDPVLIATDPAANFLSSTQQGFHLDTVGTDCGITSLAVFTVTPDDLGRVAAWPDLCLDGGQIATQIEMDRRPRYQAIAQGAITPSVAFAGSSVLTSDIAADGGTQTVFVVAEVRDLPETAGAFIAGHPMGGLELRLNPNGSLEALVTMKSSIGASVAAVPTRQTSVIALSYDSGTGEFQFYIDGLPSEPSVYLGRHVTSLEGSGGSVAIGAISADLDALNANIYEITRYGRCLRGDEIAAAAEGLAAKHGITLQPRFSALPRVPFPRSSPDNRTALRGANIHPKAADFYTDGAFDNANVWAQLWTRWEWDGWIERGIELAKGLGANTIRIIGDIRGLHQGRITRATYLDHLRQLTEYLDSQGMYLYGTSGDLRHLVDIDEMFITAELQAQADLLNDYPNVVGWDVMQEIGSSFKTFGKQRCIELARNWAAAIRSVTTGIPLTYSSISYTWDVATYREFDEFVDYFDLHLYSTPEARLGDQSIAPLLSMTSKPVMIGEFGVDTRALTTQQAVDAYEAILGLVRDNPQVVGANCWSIMNDATGLYDEAGQNLRTDLADIFTRFPLTR